jgi:hypothetical protein
LFLLSFRIASAAAAPLAGTYDGPGAYTIDTKAAFSARMQVAIFNDTTMLGRVYNGSATSAILYGFITKAGAVTAKYEVDGSTQAITGSIHAKGTSYIFAYTYKTTLGTITATVTLKKQK